MYIITIDLRSKEYESYIAPVNYCINLKGFNSQKTLCEVTPMVFWILSHLKIFKHIPTLHQEM